MCKRYSTHLKSSPSFFKISPWLSHWNPQIGAQDGELQKLRGKVEVEHGRKPAEKKKKNGGITGVGNCPILGILDITL